MVGIFHINGGYVVDVAEVIFKEIVVVLVEHSSIVCSSNSKKASVEKRSFVSLKVYLALFIEKILVEVCAWD